MDAPILQDPKKVSAIWVQVLNSIMKKMNDTKSSMIELNQKMRLNWILLNHINRKHIQNKIYHLKMLYTDIFISSVSSMETKTDKLLTLAGVKIPVG